jgi:hypothetical protein
VTDDAEPSSAAQSGIAGSACVTLRIIWPNFLPSVWHNWPKLAERVVADPSAEVMILILICAKIPKSSERTLPNKEYSTLICLLAGFMRLEVDSRFH